MTIHIKEPIWNKNKQRCVGLAEYKIIYEGVVTQVKIDYVRKKGDVKGAEAYPHFYRIDSQKVMTYPRKLVPGTAIWLRIVPIEDMREVINGKKTIAKKDINTKNSVQASLSANRTDSRSQENSMRESGRDMERTEVRRRSMRGYPADERQSMLF